jgi:membrane carboxypeptidase/penicillin-binding protein PbpC
VPLMAQASPDASKLFWFVGGKPLGTSMPAEALYWLPEPGWWALSVVDSEGRSSAVTIHVEERGSETESDK